MYINTDITYVACRDLEYTVTVSPGIEPGYIVFPSQK